MLNIRRAEKKDTGSVMNLLSQVLEVHAEIRPDLFISGTRKYTEAELQEIFLDDDRPIFVAEDEEGKVLGYCFCMLERVENANNLRDSLTLYIDDLCVDQHARGRNVGKQLCDYTVAYAKGLGCDYVTLNVWEGNDHALGFYQRMGFSVRKTTMEKRL